MDEWKSELARRKRTKEWKTDVDGDIYDPWGGHAIHHSIAWVVKGIRYDRAAAVTISIQQAGFFLYK